jgi:CrcB protein
MVKLLVVGFGGALGAMLRYLISTWIQARVDGDFPAGTLVVNVLGCFFLGGIMVFVHEREGLSPEARLLLTMGLLGSLTTFSTFGHETVVLLGEGKLAAGLGSVAANVVVGLLAVLLGQAIGRAICSVDKVPQPVENPPLPSPPLARGVP